MIYSHLSRGCFFLQATHNSRHVVLLLSAMVAYVVNLFVLCLGFCCEPFDNLSQWAPRPPGVAGPVITHNWLFLYIEFDYLFCILTCVVEQSCQSSSWIINSFFYSFMVKCHKIMKIQWISIKNVKFNIRCWLLFYQIKQRISDILFWQKLFLFLLSLIHWM